MIKIYLADDHDILLDGIEAILKNAGMAVVGKANNAEMAITGIKKFNPDILITDISMGATSGLQLTEEVKRSQPQVHVIVLSMHDDFLNMDTLLKAGASAYLLKNVSNQELLIAIKRVMEGEIYIQQSIAGKYRQACKENEKLKQKSILSPREIQIIQLMANEYSTAQISKALFISELTVETHRKNIWRKSGAKSIISLLDFARRAGILR